MNTRLLALALTASWIVALNPCSGQSQPASAVDQDLATGIRQVDEGDFDAAVVTLEGVVKRLVGDKTRSKELGRAYLYLAIAHLQLSQEAAAKTKFREAWKNDQALKLSPREFAPKIIQAFEQAKREAGAAEPPPSAAMLALLFDAVKRGDVSGLRHLLEQNPTYVNGKDQEFGATPLHWAVLKGQKTVVAYLIVAGAGTSVGNNQGETPLQVAERTKRQDLVPFLIPAGVGAPPLPGEIFEATKAGDIGRIRQILASDPNALRLADPEFGATPLHWAALKNLPATAAFLMGAGADLNATNKAGETPLGVAERGAKSDVVEILKR